ncbi:MAG TPA: ABC transporter permease [Vicinamibacterales bacterium]|nr:ABC transporter permease [Vicinamibacterales bacterium]
MDAIWQDLRFGVRVLATHCQFTTVAVLVLGLGIGATTAVFSIVNAVLLRPLPYQHPERLVAITSVYESSAAARSSPVVALSEMAEWRARSRMFSSMGAFAYTQLPMRVGNRSSSPVTALMDPQFLPTLGIPLAMGSFFDETPGDGSDMTAIVSHALWVDALASDRSAIGRAITVDGAPYVVRGVLAADFQFPRSDASYFTRPVDLLLPSSSFDGFPAQSRQWFGIARLARGVTLPQAEAELGSIAESLSRDAQTGDAWSVRLTALDEATTRRARQPLLIVLGISMVLLLIAASNLMNLFFSRGVGRLREMSIRRAIGSTTGRLVRQLLTEGVVLAALGGTFGVLLASFALDAVVALSPLHLPVSGRISIDGTVLAFTMIVCLAAAVAASLFPALHVSAKTGEAARHPGLRASAGRGVARVQQGLCVAQIALGMALLAVAGLLAHSLWRLNAVDPGFAIERILGFNLSVPNDHPLPDRVRFYQRALDEIRAIPGVEQAGLISFLPPETRAGVFMGLAIDGVPPPERGAPPRVVNTLVSSVDYFATMRMRVVHGRDFSDADHAEGRPAIIVNEALMRRYFPDGDAVGQRIGTGFDGLKPVREIVGVVQDTHDRGVAAEPIPTVYIPFRQFSLPYASIALRTAVTPESVIPVIRDRLNRLNPAVPLTDFQALDARLGESLREPRFYTLMAAACALMAVLFVTFGLYGLVSYSVSRRTAELGIRMAVGAEGRTILWMVLWQGLRMAVVGVAVGLGLAILLSRALASLLFEVTPLDPLTLSAAAAIVVLVTLAASYAPARRASRVNPIAALRYE